MKALEDGSTIKVQEWRDKFLQAGLFNVPQESAEVNKARRDWEIFKAVSQERGQKIQKARAIANNLFNFSEADEDSSEGVATPVYDSEVMEQLDRKESKQAANRILTKEQKQRDLAKEIENSRQAALLRLEQKAEKHCDVIMTESSLTKSGRQIQDKEILRLLGAVVN